MLGKQYYLNLSGKKLDEGSMRDIPRPTLELTNHISTKTVQSGAFLGTLVVGPLIALAKGPRDKEGFKSWMTTSGCYGVGLGLISGPLLSYATINSESMTIDGIWDRCYRLRYNQHQVRSDRLSLVGAVSGIVAASFLGESCTFGALIGLNTGMLLAFAFNCTIGA